MDMKKLAGLFDNPLVSKFAQTLNHNDLPANWQGNDEIVRIAGDAWRELGEESPFFRAFKGNGEVEHLYHGSSKGGIDAFNKKSSGTYLTKDRTVADDIFRAQNEYGGETYDLYARMSNPFDARWKNMGDESKGKLQRAVDSAFDESEIDDIREKLGNADWNPLESFTDGEMWLDSGRGYQDKIMNGLRSQGHDAVIFPDSPNYGWDHTSTVVFDPRQIKSVNNRGTFDPSDPNIYRAALPLAAAGGLMSALAPNDAEARIRAMDAPIEEAWNPVEAFAGGLGGGIKSAAMGVLPDGAMDWALNKFGGLMSGGK